MPQKATFPALGFTVATTSTFDNYRMVPLAFSTPSHFPFQYELQKLSGSYAECAPSLCSGSIGNLNDSRCCFRPIRPKREVSRICSRNAQHTAHSPKEVKQRCSVTLSQQRLQSGIGCSRNITTSTIQAKVPNLVDCGVAKDMKSRR